MEIFVKHVAGGCAGRLQKSKLANLQSSIAHAAVKMQCHVLTVDSNTRFTQHHVDMRMTAGH
jgi:hypothetical protein